MKKIRITAVILSALFVLSSVCFAVTGAAKLTGETARTVTELYPGVVRTAVTTPAGSTYGYQNFNIIQFDLAQQDLYLETCYYNDKALVTYGTNGSTVKNTIAYYNKTHSDKTAIAAVNGDMWMVSYAHARIEGKGTSFGGYSDAVVKKEMTVSRAFNIVDGEIYTTQQMEQETPYAAAYSFGITDDFVPTLGMPYAVINMKNVTQNKTVAVNGINRLPANNAVVMYTDRVMGTYKGFALDDAYEMLIEFDEDYTMAHGADVTGTLKAIYSSSTSANPDYITNKQMVITVRGNKISSVSSFKIGDKINFTVQIKDYEGNDEIWQRVQHAMGGNIVYAHNGVLTGNGLESGYPTTLLGYDKNGKIVILCMNGRGKNGTGANGTRLAQVCKDLDLYDAFILDGGGSMTMVVGSNVQTNPSYSTVTTSTDGSDRTVNNSLVLAFGPKRAAQGKIDIELPPTLNDPLNVTFPQKNYVKAVIGYSNEATYGWDQECLKLTVDNLKIGDPYVGFSYSAFEKAASANEYKYITLVYKIPESNSKAAYLTELFCNCEGRGAEGGQSVSAYTKRSGKFEYVTFNAGTLSKWKNNITGLRIDFFGGTVNSMANGDSFYIHNIILSKTAAEAAEVGKKTADGLNAAGAPTGTGDVNGDGATNNKDVIALFRYINGNRSTKVDESALDFNLDGSVNNKDVIALFRAISAGKV